MADNATAVAVVAYDNASAIAHKASDEDTSLLEATLASGDIGTEEFDPVHDPETMVGPL